MKRIVILGLLTLVPVIAAVDSSPAVASEACFRVLGLNAGSYTTNSCGTAGPPSNWTWAISNASFTRMAQSPYIYCVKIRTGVRSQYKDAACQDAELNTGLYSRVFAEPGWFGRIRRVAGQSKGNQVIKTTAGSVECEEMTLGGEETAEEETSQTVTAKYGKCKGFGASVTVSEAEYELGAGGQFSIVGKNITITDSAASCTVSIPASSSNKSLEEVNYTDASGAVDESANVSGVNYEPSGGSCGTKKLETNGTIKGEGEVTQEGGIEIKLKPSTVTECEAKGFCFEGKQVTGSEKYPIVSENLAGSSALMDAAGLKSECTLVKDSGNLLGEGKSDTTIEFSKCSVVEPIHCKVAEPVTFKAKDELVTFESKLADKFTPAAGTEFGAIKFESSGGTCSLAGSVAVDGSLQALLDNESEAVEHVLTFSSTSGSKLEIAGLAATFKLKDAIKLGGTVSGYKWSAKI